MRERPSMHAFHLMHFPTCHAHVCPSGDRSGYRSRHADFLSCPKLKVAVRLQDAVSITRWWSAPLQVQTTKDASLQAASSLMSYWRIWLAGLV